LIDRETQLASMIDNHSDIKQAFFCAKRYIILSLQGFTGMETVMYGKEQQHSI
jgi:hypothetical protein